MNRAAYKRTLFASNGDYAAFLEVMRQAERVCPTRLLVYCVMPNHWHLVIWSRVDGDISRYIKWLTMTHARRWRMERGTNGEGAVYQGRFRWVPVQTDIHLLRACRYVERNPVRADLVTHAEHWPWSSATSEDRKICEGPRLGEWPIPRPDEWLGIVNEPDAASELAELRRCVTRGFPYGSEPWQIPTAVALRS